MRGKKVKELRKVAAEYGIDERNFRRLKRRYKQMKMMHRGAMS